VEVVVYDYTAAALGDYLPAGFRGSAVRIFLWLVRPSRIHTTHRRLSELVKSLGGLDFQRHIWEELKDIWSAIAPETRTIMFEYKAVCTRYE
jgi:hypothetical protein